MPYIGNELATQFQAFVTQTITGDGSTGYTLDRAVANGKELLVYINNVKQEEGSGKAYTASGTTITFSDAVASTDSCYVVFLGSAVQTVAPPDGSVSSAKLDTNIAVSGTLGVTGAVTANAGINVDNITIDGTEIDLSSGDLTVDVAGNVILDADGGYVQFKDGGTEHFRIFTDNSGDVNFNSMISDKDIHFHGNDGGSDVLALALDMSDAGAATLNNGLTLTDGDLTVASGHGINFAATANSSGSMSSELLSDYEEGTWTPTFPNGGTAGTIQNATYTKIGRMVYAGVYFGISAITNNTSAFLIGGLPFTAAGTNNYHTASALTYVGAFNWDNTNGFQNPTIQSGNNYLYFHRGDGSAATIRNDAVQDLVGKEIIFALWYTT